MDAKISLIIIFSTLMLISGLLWVIFAFLMALNKKPGVKLYDPRVTLYFSGNKHLTEKGIYWRNKSIIPFVVFVVGLLLLLSFLLK